MINTKEQKIYTGNFILTSGAFLLIGFFIFSCFLAIKGISEGNNRGWVLFPVFIIVFALETHRMNYFILTDKKLVVKNPIWFWKTIEFDLDKINVISIVLPFRYPKSLEIKTENSTKLIPASSLRNKTWKELKRDLEEKNIIVND